MDISRVRQALADAVAAHVDLGPDLGLQCFGYVPDSITPPTFYAGEVEINNLFTFGADDDITVHCRAFTSTADDRAGQQALDALLKKTGSTSIREALELAKGAPGEYALGGACDDIVVQKAQGYRLYRIGETAYFGAEILVRAIGNGDGA